MSSVLNILVINPNSSKSITQALEKALRPTIPSGIVAEFYNPLKGPPGIKDAETAEESCRACMDELTDANYNLEAYDGFLVACFSEHPLIGRLQTWLQAHHPLRRLLVLGIVHAGLAAALVLSDDRFGILATGSGEKPNLVQAVSRFTGTTSSSRFAGVITSDLQVVDLQDGDQALVEQRIKDTTRKLLARGATTIILGCAGMSGMNHWVEAAAQEQGSRVRVVDSVLFGVHLLVSLIRTS